MKKLSFKKGFTLIELLVVIAIIGILASVVLASLNSARNKGKDAAVQAQLANMRAQGELYYTSQSPNSYGTGYAAGYYAAGGTTVLPTSSCTITVGTGMFAAGTNTLDTLIKGACSSGATVIKASTDAATATKWALQAQNASGTYNCVDSLGESLSQAGAFAMTAASGTCN